MLKSKFIIPLFCAFVLGVLFGTSNKVSAGEMTLINPDWTITLTDAGYSDLLFDQRPGFEGREYLSGEWGTK